MNFPTIAIATAAIIVLLTLLAIAVTYTRELPDHYQD
jgi:hypothetical protein